ncbi:MAG: hypothetical protein ABIO79_04965 [Ferruginibacter sp.]
MAQVGSWNIAAGSASITIYYPTDIFREMAFMNRTWMVTETSPGMFTVTSEGDEVRLVIKK